MNTNPYKHKCPVCGKEVINFDPNTTQPCSVRCKKDLEYRRRFKVDSNET